MVFSARGKLVSGRCYLPLSLFLWQQLCRPQSSSFPWPASGDLAELATFLTQSSLANRLFLHSSLSERPLGLSRDLLPFLSRMRDRKRSRSVSQAGHTSPDLLRRYPLAA